ncbi:MAG TPA: hypothetical protein VFI65_34435 [Streptosporangiaceae bacterium]|nr:hypothetical protein [Streptosporangiaceae bacterium]
MTWSSFVISGVAPVKDRAVEDAVLGLIARGCKTESRSPSSPSATIPTMTSRSPAAWLAHRG